MVKFSKQFEGQLVPEWKHAFLDYCLLKKDLKRMQHARHHAAADRRQAAGLTDTQETAAGHHAERASLSLSQWLLDRLPAGLFGSNAPNRDRHGVIHVRTRCELTPVATRTVHAAYIVHVLSVSILLAS
jgi:xenotropic and polytropic retrovirus receptor 1